MKKSILVHSIVVSMLCLVHADELDSNKDLESLLDNASDLATQKSLNVDYLPSVVTIIDASTYIDAGIQTIAEALDMLPGIQMQISQVGYTTSTVRGLKMPNTYLSDKIKVMIDGIAINTEIAGSNSYYMDFPMQLVERIEVLRGPNSTLYGAGAFYGTVNVITKLGNSKKENQLFAGVGSYQYRTAGVNVNTASGEWKLFADGYYTQNDKALRVENTERRTQEAMEDFSVGFKATNGGLEFLTRLKQGSMGNYYSYAGELDPIEQRDQGRTNSYFFSQLSYKTAYDDYKLETKANFSQRTTGIKANILDVATTKAIFSAVGITMDEGYYATVDTVEESFEAEAILTLPKINSHDVLVGVGVRQVNITKDEIYSSVEDTIIKNPAVDYTNLPYFGASKEAAFWANPTTRLLPENMDRTLGYGYIQDLISIGDDVDLVLGLRADEYSDYGLQLSKRAGLVYRASDTTILKLLYGSAFRVPSLVEGYANGHVSLRAGDSRLKPEETNTYEIVGIYTPNLNHKFSLNLFYSQLKNIIDLEEIDSTPTGYQNMKQRYAKGAEFEYFYRTAREHSFYLNGSYVYAQYTVPSDNGASEIDQSMPDMSNVMLKAMYVYRPTEELSLGTAWRYFSQTKPNKGHSDSKDISEMHILDQTATYRFTPNSEMRLTVKNLFNTEVRMPSYNYVTGGEVVREGRNYFLSYIYNF
ncbi:MAG: TonB-dependent receptor [Sulfuricurvum sp.]|nr:TonB-dependent receptor [Sulfuricurvum sp.]